MMTTGRATRQQNQVFRTTFWTQVLEAGDVESPEYEDAMTALYSTYWFPLYGFARRSGRSEHHARDLVQDFFGHLLEKGVIATADQDRGRFRSFLIASFRNFMGMSHRRANQQKRGGGVDHFPIEGADAEYRYLNELVHNETPEHLYERKWAQTLIERVMTRLARDCEAAGEAERFELLNVYLADPESGPSYEESARKLGVKPGTIKSAVYRLRKRFRDIFLEELAAVVSGHGDIEDEAAHLMKVLAR